MDNNFTIGIPRALLFYKYHTLWETFFNELGINILISPSTNDEILNMGIKNSIYEYCMALKIYMGHIAYLKDKVDYILVPTIISQKNNIVCECFYHLYDIVKNTFDVNLINYKSKINDELSQEEAFIKMGVDLGFGKANSKRAYDVAKMEEYKQNKIKYLLQNKKLNKENKRILLVGYSYYIRDNLIVKKLIDNLDKYKIDIIYSDINDFNNICSKNLYFYDNNRINMSILNYIKSVDGIIFVSTHPCESDFELISYYLSEINNINLPYFIYNLSNKDNENFKKFINNLKEAKYDR